jgi:hypothetical protein
LNNSDSDTVCDRDDVCPTVTDPLQLNGDGDIFGDACDVCPGDTDNDSDEDGYCLGTVYNPPKVGGGDPCSRSGGSGDWEKPTALFGRLNPPFGDEKMRLKGAFTMGSSTPVLAPDVHGIQVRVVDRNKNIVVDEHIPGGPFNGSNGWRTVGLPPFKWIYLDKNKPALRNGIVKVTVIDRSRITPGLVRVLVKGKNGNYQLVPGQEPLRVTAELNDTSLPPGGTPGRDQCGEAVFLDLPAEPSCLFATASLKCR